MPEYPDITMYLERLRARVGGQVLRGVRLVSPFLLRSVDPPLREVHSKRVLGFRRLGKRIVFEIEDDLFLVLHLMIAGRLRWKKPGTKPNRRVGLAGFDFDAGTLVLTEASSKKRASLYVVRGEEALAAHDPGGLEVFEADVAAFTEALRAERHTLKRSLTDPRLFSGIGNAYSDEILHRARLSPVQWSTNLSDEEVERLFTATRDVLVEWTYRLRAQVGDGFPDKVTAFHDEMAVHGRYREPCPVCGDPVQRIVYAENETNYCATCQTGGKLLRDRALSQLLKKDWPKTLDELERRLQG